jgi:CMP-N-acetylneuraminic acid synthetase
MKVLCVIPARGGSKRIPNKNIKKFLGKPLIYHTIKAAINSKIFDKIVVSTDSKKIKNIAKKYGAEVPFIRPKRISGDVPTEDVTVHAVNFYKKRKIEFDLVFTL